METKMKNFVLITLITVFLTGITFGMDVPVRRTNENFQKIEDSHRPETYFLAGRVKEFLEIQKRMNDIQKSVIQQDQELRQLAEQIRVLQEQLRNRVEDKLKDNQEYQLLKQKRQQIYEQYKKSGAFEPRDFRRFQK